MALLDSLRKLKSDFKEIASGGFELPAWHDPTRFRAEAAAMRARTAAMRKRRRRRDRSAVLPKWVVEFERLAKEYETITTDADGRRWTFEVPGESPKDPYRVKRFCLIAARAAMIVGLVNAGATEDVKVFAWLGELKARRPDLRRGDADEITRVIAASQLLLEELENDADIAARQLCAVLAARADQLSRVALDARSSAVNRRPDQTETSESARRWEEVTIRVLSDHSVQVGIAGVWESSKTFTELGFEDRRTQIPNSAWMLLQELAQHDGVISKPPSSKGWRKVEKQIQALRKQLRNTLHIAGDPLPFIKKTGYRASFRIECHPALDPSELL
jgi:hypothetical protein